MLIRLPIVCRGFGLERGTTLMARPRKSLCNGLRSVGSRDRRRETICGKSALPRSLSFPCLKNAIPPDRQSLVRFMTEITILLMCRFDLESNRKPKRAHQSSFDCRFARPLTGQARNMAKLLPQSFKNIMGEQ